MEVFRVTAHQLRNLTGPGCWNLNRLRQPALNPVSPFDLQRFQGPIPRSLWRMTSTQLKPLTLSQVTSHASLRHFVLMSDSLLWSIWQSSEDWLVSLPLRHQLFIKLWLHRRRLWLQHWKQNASRKHAGHQPKRCASMLIGRTLETMLALIQHPCSLWRFQDCHRCQRSP